MQEELFVKGPVWADDLPPENPMYGWGRKRVGAQMNYMQALGERLNIRLILTYDPESEGREQEYRELMREVVALISEEQAVDYSDVPVRLVDDLPETDAVKRFRSHETIISGAQVLEMISRG